MCATVGLHDVIITLFLMIDSSKYNFDAGKECSLLIRRRINDGVGVVRNQLKSLFVQFSAERGVSSKVFVHVMKLEGDLQHVFQTPGLYPFGKQCQFVGFDVDLHVVNNSPLVTVPSDEVVQRFERPGRPRTDAHLEHVEILVFAGEGLNRVIVAVNLTSE